MKPILGSRNRLVRRLGMHANMTGLFRFSETLQSGSARAGEPGKASAAEAERQPLAKAFLPQPEPLGETGMASPGNSFSAPETDSIAAPAGKTGMAQSPDLPSAGSRPGPARIEAPAPVPSGNVFRVPEPDRLAAPAAEEDKKSSQDDPVWHRLQNIFNKHRQKNTPQEAASLPGPQEGEVPPPDPPAAEEVNRVSASPQPEPPAHNETGMPSIQMKRETAGSPPVQAAGAPLPGAKSETNFAPAEEQPGSLEPASPADVIQAAGEGSQTTPLPASTQADKAGPAEPLAPILSGETGEPAQSEQVNKPLSQPIMESPDPQATSLQSLPLEAVWAVERVRQPQNPLPPVPDQDDNLNFSEEDMDWPVESANADQTFVQRSVLQDEIVSSALREVHPAQASESGIEFIPPRRPRPVAPLTGSSAPATEIVHPPAEPPQAEVQHGVDPGPQRRTGEPGLVPTEIGPLPEDLWNLVGAATPPVTNAAPASGEVLELEEQSSLKSASFPASQPGQTGQSPLVQRQANPPEGAAPASSPPATGKGTVEEQAGEDINIEELARQVYSELKHRLGLEWERLRRR